MEAVHAYESVGKTIKVLLIEDSLADARLIQTYLKKVPAYYFEITVCQTIKDALDKAVEEIFDVVISDLSLPDAGGWETIAQLLGANLDAPIVLLTGVVDEALELKAIQNGIESYLNKEFLNPEFVSKTIIHALERYRLRKLWKKSQLQFQKIIQQSGDGILVLDEQSGRILYANPAAEHFFHARSNPLVGKLLGKFVTNQNFTEISLVDPHNNEISVEVQITTIDWEDKPALLASLRDITHRKELDKITRENEILEKIRNLSGAIAHEFSQPLQIIGHSLELHMMENGDNERLKLCRKNLQRAVRLVRQLQNINSLETKAYLDTEIIDIEASSRSQTSEDEKS
jgi:CheY-like chemotaxis protein